MLKEYLSTLANAIRSKLGTTDKINAQNFPDKINEVYDKGKYDEWSEFWDAIQTDGGKEASYDYKFCGYAWNDTTFKPKYNIKVRYNAGVSAFQRSRITDLEKALKDSGVVLDLSRCGNINYMFGGGAFTILPELDLRQASGLYETFNTASLHTIRKILSSESTNWGIYTFHRNTASKLANIVIEGVIAKTLTFQYQTLLTVESIKSVIKCLKNFTGTGNEYSTTVTFTEAHWEALEADSTPKDEGIEFEGTWKEYVVNALCWNV